MGNRGRISELLMYLGAVASHQGDYEQAEEYLLEGLSLAQEIGNSELVFYLVTNMGEVTFRRGDFTQAERYFQEALALARNMGHRWSISYILNDWGELYLKQQKLDSAFAAFREALELAQAGGIQELMGVALYGLARVTAVQGNTIEARRQAQKSLQIFEAIGHFKAAEVAQWLTTLPAADPSE
jgi:tetratricopeptide (TPR) repeat protein